MASESASNEDMATQQKLLIKDVEDQSTRMSIKKPRQLKQIKIKHFPIFMIGLSVIQVCNSNLQEKICVIHNWLSYSGDHYVYDGCKTPVYGFRNRSTSPSRNLAFFNSYVRSYWVNLSE